MARRRLSRWQTQCSGVAAALVFQLLAAVGTTVAAPPNIVVILTDDQGWGDLSSSGNRNLSTPQIDSLARDGATIDHFFVCPVCSPTRAEFLTGRYHPRGNVFSTSTGGERLDLDERTIADVLSTAGYATGAFGKWHNGSQYPFHPLGRGFQEFYGFCSGHWGDYFSPPLERNGEPVRGRGYIIDDVTDEALAFIREHRRQPFFCYVPYNSPHSPMQVPNQFYARFRDKELLDRHQEARREDPAMTRAALAMCENIDWNVGRILSLLDELKLSRDTIVVFFCDNGPNSFRWNGGLRGRKGSTDEGGVRSPCYVRWPGTIPAGQRVAPIAGAIDLLPTLADLADVRLPEGKPLDGISLQQWLVGAAPPAVPDRVLFSHWAGRVSARTQRHRLDDQGRLYDMQMDPGQTNDVAAKTPEVARTLADAVQEWRRTVLVELSQEPQPFPVGYREFPKTYLPARDGQPHGGVERSGKAPNCSFFRNWTSSDDRITWDIDVANAGRYAVTLDYTCEPENAGSTIELSLGEQRLTAKLEQPFTSLLRGQQHDRVDRGPESYVKDFAPWNMGTIELPAGPGSLQLRATSIPGRAVMEVRGLSLTLLD